MPKIPGHKTAAAAERSRSRGDRSSPLKIQSQVPVYSCKCLGIERLTKIGAFNEHFMNITEVPLSAFRAANSERMSYLRAAQTGYKVRLCAPMGRPATLIQPCCSGRYLSRNRFEKALPTAAARAFCYLSCFRQAK